MGTVTITDSRSVKTYGSTSFGLRFTYSESYTASTNTTTVHFSDVEIMSSRYVGASPFYGGYKLDGNQVDKWVGNQTLGVNANDYTSLPKQTPTDISIQLDNTGNKTVTLSLFAGAYSSHSDSYVFGIDFAGDIYGVRTSKTGSLALTTQSRSLYVQYDANGGSGAPSKTYFYGTTESITLSSTEPTRTGYTFAGWNTKADGTGTTYAKGANIGTRTSNLTLYAKWTVNSYTLTLTAGTNVASVSGGGSKNYNASVTVTATLSTATGYHFAFDGWYNGSTKESSSNPYTFSMPAAAKSLTAKGTKTANTYTVVFNKNGGSGSMSNQSFTYDASQALRTNSFAKTGYDFLGWSTSSSATTATYTDGQSVKNLTATNNGTVTLYAVWKIKTYTVSYNANGHGTAPSSQTKTYGVDLTLRSFISNQSGTGTKANYTVTADANGSTWSGSNGSASKTPNYVYSQTYWNTNSSGTGTNYSSASSYSANAAATLYAIWKTTTTYTYTYTLPTGTPTKSQSVTVTFNANGGSTTKASQNVSRAMTFSGWYTAATGGTKRTTSSQISTNETVYAQFTNGSGNYGAVTLPTESQCTRTGYTLKGWYTAASGGTKVGNPGASYTPTGAVTLYAQWEPLTYTLSFTKSPNGVVANVERTASPIGGSTGLLSDGSALYYGDTLKVQYSVNSGYTLQTATINGVAMGGTSETVSNIAAAVSVVITVELGAIVYIGNQDYQAFVWNGSSFDQYEAYIYDGNNWVAY